MHGSNGAFAQVGDIVAISRWVCEGKNPCNEIVLTTSATSIGEVVDLVMITSHFRSILSGTSKYAPDFRCLAENGERILIRRADIIRIVTVRDTVRNR